MRRLRGQGTPYTPPATAYPTPPSVSNQEVEELKQAVRALGAKLKSTYDTLATKETEAQAKSQKNQELADSVQHIQTLLKAKEEELDRVVSSEHQTATALLEAQTALKELDRVVSSERQTAAALLEAQAALEEIKSKREAPPSDLTSLQDEVAALKARETEWQEEKRTLEAFLERERQRRSSDNSNTNGQMVRLAMACKQLEEEAHSLRCERAATLREFNQIKEQLEEALRTLSSERELKATAEGLIESDKQTIQELKAAIETHAASIHALTLEKEAAVQRDASYLSTISELNVTIAKGKANVEAVNASLTVAEENRAALHVQLEQERQSSTEAREAQSRALKEKEAAEARVREVEELLITKLQTIADQEEQLGEALSKGEDLEHRALTAEKDVERLTADVQKYTGERDGFHEKALKLEQQLGRRSTENAELKKRTETFDRLKKSIAEASSHAHAILRTLGHGPKLQPSEELSYREPESERPLFEERFEQHELF